MLSSGLTAAAMILTSTSVSPGYGTGMSRMHLHPRHAAPVSPIPPAPQATLCPTSPSQSPAPGCTEGELPHQRQRFRRYGCPRSRSVCRTPYARWGRSFLPRQSNAAFVRPSSFSGSTSSFTTPTWSSARHARFLIKTWTHEFESDPDSQPGTVFESLFCHMKKHQAFYEVLHATGRDNVLRTSLREKIGLTQELANEEAYRKAFFADGISGWIEEWIERGMPETPGELNESLRRYVDDVLSSLNQLFVRP